MSEKEKDELSLIIVTESLLQSILSDIFTFGLLLLVLYVNHHYCGSSWMVELTIVMGFWVVAWRRGSKKVRTMEPAEAKEYLDKYLSEQSKL